MPIDLQVIHASDFVCIDAHEHLHFDESKKALQKLAATCRKRGLHRAMVDLRELPMLEKPRFTNADLAALIGAFREAGFSRHQRLAVLFRHDLYGNVRNFTFFSRMRGLQVQAFLEFEDAICWLWGGKENPEPKHGLEVPVLARGLKKRTANFTGRIHIAAADGPVRRSRRKHR